MAAPQSYLLDLAGLRKVIDSDDVELPACSVLEVDSSIAVVYNSATKRIEVSVAPAIAGAATPLSNTFFVDAGYAGASARGSAGAPFATLTDGIAAVDDLGSNGGVLVTPGSYSGESTIAWAGTGSPPRLLSVLGLAVSQDGSATTLPTLDTSGTGVVSLENVTATLDGSGPIFARNCSLTGTGDNDFFLRGGSFQGASGAGGIDAADVVLGTVSDCAFLVARDGVAEGSVTCSGANVGFLDTVVSEITVTFTGSPGVLSLSPTSYFYWVTSGSTLVNGIIEIIGATTPLEISPTALTTNTNNYTTGNIAVAEVLRLSATGAVDLTGIVAPTIAAGAVMSKRILNVGANAITLKHQSGSSSAENRFLCASGADVAIAANGWAEIYYDFTTQRWRVR